MLVIKCLNDDDCMKPRPFLSRTLNAILTQKLSPPRVGRREEGTPDQLLVVHLCHPGRHHRAELGELDLARVVRVVLSHGQKVREDLTIMEKAPTKAFIGLKAYSKRFLFTSLSRSSSSVSVGLRPRLLMARPSSCSSVKLWVRDRCQVAALPCS